MNLNDLFKEFFDDLNGFFGDSIEGAHGGFSCSDCGGPVAPLTGGFCEGCKMDELNKQLGAIVNKIYGSEKDNRDEMAMFAMGIPSDYNPYHCNN
tara:strand:- start:151 stop:435 length:285 start_codon:yes stop_codon:yes gene_type:complete